MVSFRDLFGQFNGMRVGVIGDVMLDSYLWGTVERISPEAPVPVVTVQRKEQRIGGAGNVALNCRALGAEVAMLSVTGQDEDADALRRLFGEEGISTQYLLAAPGRITTNKTRVISRNQQMMRLDAEITDDLSPADEALLLEQLREYLANDRPAVVIFEDYNKGVLTERVIREGLALCRQAGVLTAVDPKRRHFFAYRDSGIFKPNLKEVKDALNLPGLEVSLQAMQGIHAQLSERLGHGISLITLSEKGIYFQEGEHAGIIPTHIRNIADVSGAGDTVIAVASMCYAATRNVKLMAEMANIAGGLVCEEVGTAAIRRDRLLQECELLLA